MGVWVFNLTLLEVYIYIYIMASSGQTVVEKWHFIIWSLCLVAFVVLGSI